MKNSFLVFYSFILMAGLNLTAQNTHFINLHRKDGLSSNKITAIHQDGYGYMWFGTKKGLNRYDGHQIDTYLPIENDSSSVRGFFIQNIFYSSSGKLILTSDRGLDVFDYKNENFKRITQLEAKANCILEGKNKNVFIALENESIEVYDKELKYLKTNDIKKLFKEKFNIINGISTLFKYDKNRFIFNVINKGFYTYDINSGEINFLANDKTKGANIYKILFVDSNEFWVAASNGIYIYKNGKVSNKLIKGKTVGSLNSINVSDLQLFGNRIWIFTYGGGINVYDRETQQISYVKQNRNDEHAISSNFISTSYIDNQGSLWVGNEYDGVSQLCTDNSFTTYKMIKNFGDKQTDVPVSALFSDSKKRIWVGSDGNGLYELKNHEVIHISDHRDIKRIRSINELPSGELLLGTFRNGLNTYNIKTKKVTNSFNINAVLGKKAGITSIVLDNSKQLWVGSHKLIKLDNIEGIGTLNSLKVIGSINRPIYSLLSSSKDSIFYGTYDGFYLFVNGKNQLILGEVGPIHSILKENNSEYWLATGQGLCSVNINTKKATYFDLKEGLNDRNLKSLVADNSNNIWFGTPEGISKINKTTKEIDNYTYRDGFLDNTFARTVVLKNNNKLYFGGYNGLLEFCPDSVKLKTTINEVVFKNILINHERIREKRNEVTSNYIAESKKITLKSHQKVFTIDYSSFDFKYPEKIKFSYMLKGYEDQWKITSERSLTFMNLSPGNYTLMIKASDASGNWDANYSSIQINVLPAWWQTYWFKLLLICLVIAIIYFVSSAVLQRKKLKLKFEFEKESLKRQRELDEQQLSFFTNLSHEIRTPLSLILSPVEEILKRTNIHNTIEVNNFKLIKKNAIRIRRLLNNGIDFRKTQFKEPELQARNINIIHFLKEVLLDFNGVASVKNLTLSIESDFDDLKVWLDLYMMETVFYNLFSNAIKYSSLNGVIVLKIVQEKEYVVITVQDSGEGIHPNDIENIFERFYQANGHLEGSGIGLALVKRFVDAHKGSISVRSELGKGSCFEVRLLLGDNHINSANKVSQKNVLSVTNGTKVIEIDKTQNFDKEKHKLKFINKNILIVEDHLELLSYLETYLLDEYCILKATDGFEAISVLKNNKIDLVISDIMIPKMNGLELCNTIKNNPETNNIPVILLTAKIMSKDKIKGYEIGADAYIEKPFQLDVLRARIHNLLESKIRQHNKFLEYLNVEHAVENMNNEDEEFYNKVLGILENNVSNPKFDIPLFVKEIGMSKSVIYKKMNKITDISINDLLVKIRLNKASKLIIHTDKTIQEIATLVGFQNSPYFSSCFKKQFLTTPSDFRKNKLKIKS